ncbi:MAG: competence/damage-inducible protein A [Candidatus Goldiibacteriota bacterium]
MNAEVLTIGTELLLGQILDTNTLYLGKKLAEVGVNLYYKTTVGDNIGRVKEALTIACSRVDIVIITGGLGPTVDDITRQAVSEFTGKKLVADESALSALEARFYSRGIKMTENNRRQAFLPEGSLILENPNGTAPGFIIEAGGKAIAAMPGVPMEMYPMMKNSVIPYIIGKLGGTHQVIKSRSLKVAGLGESLVDDRINDLFRESSNPTIGVYAHSNEVEIRLTAKAGSIAQAEELIDGLEKKIYEKLGDNIYGRDEETLEEKCGELLKKSGLTISAAESCTAGIFSGRLTNVPGSSAYFTGSIVSYDNSIKTKILGVDGVILEKYGAVSPESAAAMAASAKKLFNTGCAVSITGIAGPDGGTAEKPAGLVYIGVDIKGAAAETHRFVFPGSREGVRSRAVQAALWLLLQGLKEKTDEK